MQMYSQRDQERENQRPEKQFSSSVCCVLLCSSSWFQVVMIQRIYNLSSRWSIADRCHKLIKPHSTRSRFFFVFDYLKYLQFSFILDLENSSWQKSPRAFPRGITVGVTDSTTGSLSCFPHSNGSQQLRTKVYSFISSVTDTWRQIEMMMVCPVGEWKTTFSSYWYGRAKNVSIAQFKDFSFMLLHLLREIHNVDLKIII